MTAKHVAGKLSEIVGGIGKVTAIVAEIATAAREQATGIDQVNRAIVEMDKVTQQNAASAEESSSAASELSGQAEELAAMVGTFQLERRTSDNQAHRGGPAGALRPRAQPAPRALRPPASKPTQYDRFPMDMADMKDF